MKKIFILLAIVIGSITNTFAADNDISKSMLGSFSENFSNASDVKWEKTANFCKASFVQNGQSLFALFATDGSLVAVSRNILSTALPIYLQPALAKNLTGRWLSELVEYAIGDSTVYYATIENADETTIFESTGTAEWSLVKRVAK